MGSGGRLGGRVGPSRWRPYAAKAYGVIWNRLSDRAALDQAVNWASFAARLASQAGWKATACAYQHALLLSQRAAAGGGPEGDLDLAIYILRVAAGQVPGDHRYQYRLASALLTRYRTPRRADGDLDEAVNAAQRAVRAGPPTTNGVPRACMSWLPPGWRAGRAPSVIDHDLDLALQAIESELENQPGEDNLLTAAVRVFLQRSQPGDLEKAAYHGERLAAGLKADDPDVRTSCAPSPGWRPNCSTSPVTPAISTRASASLSARLRLVMIPAGSTNARTCSHGFWPGVPVRWGGGPATARAAALAHRDEAASPIPELALSSIRAGSRACLAEGDWAGAARSAAGPWGCSANSPARPGRTSSRTGSASPRAWPRWEPTAWCGRATRRRGPALRARRRHHCCPYRCRRPFGRPGSVLAAAACRALRLGCRPACGHPGRRGRPGHRTQRGHDQR